MNTQYIISYMITAAIVLASIVLAICIVAGCVMVINRRKLKHRSMIWLEITPPSFISRTPEATEQLFSVIHGNHVIRSFKDRILGRLPVMSFEIVATRHGGIRYLAQIEKSQVQSLEKAIMAYIPSAKVATITNYQTEADRVVEFKQTGHYILPLTLTAPLEQHDPLSYVTNAMTKLGVDEQISLQLILTPFKPRDALTLSRRILNNEDILTKVTQGNRISIMPKVLSLFGNISLGLTDMASEMYNGTSTHNYSRPSHTMSDLEQHLRPARTLSAFELELMESMHQKVTQPLFLVSLRVLVSSAESKERISTLRTALSGFSVPLYQSLKTKIRLPLLRQYQRRLALRRLPSLRRRNSLLLSASEVASLYHFPSSQISQTDNLITSLSRTLPAPVSLKSGKPLAVLIGENRHHGSTTPIGLSEAERERHMYIIGGTGNGKTTMLLYSIVQDIKNGKGVAVLDPHGDLAETILRYIPEERIGDVIYMNPDDLSHPIGMNLLELSDELHGDDLLREKDLITESTISVMRKIFSEDDSGGHRIEYILRNSIQTALTLEKPTLFTIFELLNDAKFRRAVTNSLEDENLKSFWKNEIGKAGYFQKVKMAAGITAKIGRFLFSASARRVLEQEKSTIDFDDILDSGKILICNFSKGLLGEDTSTLFGTTVLAKLQLASLRRARLAQTNRNPYYLYVDEFQNFATMSFVQMLSEARKYKLFLTMAEQSTSQQDQQRLVDIILANVGTVVCFRSGSPADERLVLPLFSPYIDQGEIANLPAYSYYVRIAAVHSQEPMSGVTVLLDNDGSGEAADKAIQSSRSKYASTVSDASLPKVKPMVIADSPAPVKKNNRRRKSQPSKITKVSSAGAKQLG
jgi:hypothetical protein